MVNKYKKEIEEINRKVYGNKTFADLKRTVKKKVCLMWIIIKKPIVIF